MADIGVPWKRSASVQRAIVNGWAVKLVLPAATAIPLPRNDVGRRIADWAAHSLQAVRAMVRAPEPRDGPERRYHHPHRESFIEDAAMSREMCRL